MSIKRNAPLELDRYVPFLVTSIANRWTATSSRLYLGKFGVGIVEWRLLVAIGHYEQCTARDAVLLSNLDPGAVSRAVRTLERRGLIEAVPGRFAGRSKPYKMTQAGLDMHDAIRTIALAREDHLLGGLQAGEREILIALLGKVHASLDVLQARA